MSERETNEWAVGAQTMRKAAGLARAALELQQQIPTLAFREALETVTQAEMIDSVDFGCTQIGDLTTQLRHIARTLASRKVRP